MMDWDDMGQGHGLMGFGWLLAALLLVVVISLAVFVAMGLFVRPRSELTSPATGPSGPSRSAAESELELRYARGEIDAAELVEARSVLRER